MTRDEAVEIRMRSHVAIRRVAGHANYAWSDDQIEDIAAIEIDELVELGVLTL